MIEAQPPVSATVYSSPAEDKAPEIVTPSPVAELGSESTDGMDTEDLEGEDDGEEVGKSDWWRYLIDKVTTLKEWTAGLFRGTKNEDSESEDER